MPASRVSPAWDQVRPVPPARQPSAARDRALRLAGAALFAALLWWAGLEIPAIVLVAAVAVLSLAGAVWPAFDRAVTGAVDRVGRAAAAALSAVLMGAVHLFVLLPAAILIRFAGRDPLQLRFDEGAVSYWTRRRPVPARLASRQYTVEPPLEPRGRRSFAARLALAVGVTVLVLAANYAVGAAWDALQSAAGDDPRAATPAMAGVPWAEEWFDEFAEVRQRWEPLIGLVSADHRGTHINVEGFTRASYQPAAAPPEAPTVWFFGGSTTWGTGQRDGHTIPSEVARLAEAGGTPIVARNYGQRGWAIWQGTALLTQLLAAGEQPDVAVFYDGINEVAAQFQDPGGRPTYMQAQRVADAVDDAASGLSLGDLYDAYREHSAVHKLATALSGRPAGEVPPEDELERRAQDAVDVHRAAVDHLGNLAALYGFDPVFFWQPSVHTKPEGEEATRRAMSLELRAIGRMHVMATPLVEPPVVDISGVFGDDARPLFFDWSHTNEEGAALVAAAIYAELRPLLEEVADG